MRRPLIGITGNLSVVEGEEKFNGMKRTFSNQDYVDFVNDNHAVPVILPAAEKYETETVEQMVQVLDGIMLAGGYDITPSLYGEDACEYQGYSMSCIDEFYRDVILLARRYKKPVFGICKGMQAINAVYGGTLYQDLSSQRRDTIQHQQSARRQDAVHRIKIKDSSFLSECISKEEIWVNSHHHQAVKDLAPGFRVTAYALDGVIEGMERFDEAPVIGVQWHPEMMAAGGNTEQLRIFEKFLEYCRG